MNVMISLLDFFIVCGFIVYGRVILCFVCNGDFLIGYCSSQRCYLVQNEIFLYGYYGCGVQCIIIIMRGNCDRIEDFNYIENNV